MRRLALALFTVMAVLGAVAGSWAYFTTSGSGTASGSVGSLNPPPQPSITYTEGTAEVELNWPPGSTLSDGETPAQGYYVTRDNGSTTSPACGTSPTSLATSTSCTDTAVPNGTYTYQVVAVWNSFSATSPASESVEVVLGGGALVNPIWTTSNSEAEAIGASYTYSFTTATKSGLTSVTMTVPSGTSGTPAVGAVSGVPSGGTVSLVSNTLTYTFEKEKTVNKGVAASIQITGLTNTPNVNSYTSQITTKKAATPIDSGVTPPVAITGATLVDPLWTVSDSLAGATGVAYTYSFRTVNEASLTSVTMTVPEGTAGTPSATKVTGVPSGGTVSLVSNVLTYTFESTSVAASTAVSIKVTGLTNTSTAGSYTSQITTNNLTVPIENGTTASAVAFTSTALTSPTWTPSKSESGATGVAYTYSFTTAKKSALTSVTMTVPPGTGGTPAVGAVSGVPAGGEVSLAGNTLTYAFGSQSVNAGVASSIQITGLTNTSTVGGYTSLITTYKVAAPIDSGITPLVVLGDTTPPTGTIEYTNGYNNTGTVAVTFSATDKGSGVDTESGQLKRASATLSAGSCGSFGEFENVGPEGVSSPYNDSSVATNTCYKYEYIVADNYGLKGTITSASVVKVDTTGPSGGSVSVPAYSKTTSVSVTFSAGTDSGSGINASSGQLKRASATLSAGSCGSFGEFANTGSAGPTSPVSNTGLENGKCYEYQYVVADNAGNSTTYGPSAPVQVDTTAPTNSLSLTSQTGNGSYLSGTTLYYRGSATGSFKIQNAVSDSGSGPASSAFPALGGTATGWTHTGSTVTTPAGGPYVSNEFKWSASTSSSPTELVTGADAAGNTAETTLSLTNDSTAPSGGFVSVPAYSNKASVEVTFSPGTDGGSGINTATPQLNRAIGTYEPLTDECSGFGGFEPIGSPAPTSPFKNSSLSNGKCYEYEYVVSDNVGNSVTYGPSTVKVDRAGPKVSALGGSGTGLISNGSTLTITFDSQIDPASIAPGCPSSCVITGAKETRTNNENVLLVIPGITAGSNTGSSEYLSGTTTATATFTATVAFSAENTVLTVTVSALAGATPAASEGRIVFAPAETITDPAGNTATGTKSVNHFKLF